MNKQKPLCFILIFLLSLSCFLSVSDAKLPSLLRNQQEQTEEQNSYLWPLTASRQITSGFGNRKIAIYGRERLHTGVDLLAATGAEVVAVQSGTVIVSTYDGGWGHYIIINHGNNILSLYAHLNSRTVERGESVTRGQLIGEVGNTGISTAPHLHFEMRENGKAFNPFRLTYSDE